MNVLLAVTTLRADEGGSLPAHLPSVPLLPNRGAQLQSLCRIPVRTLLARRAREEVRDQQPVLELHQGGYWHAV